MTSILVTTALTTYAAAKSRLNAIGVQIVDADHQPEVERAINAISAAVESYCDRAFRQASRAETYAPPRGERLILRQAPILTSAAPTAKLDGDTVSSIEVEDAERGYLWRDGGWQASEYEEETDTIIEHFLPGSAQRILVVTYTAGWVLPGDSGTRGLPWDLEEAVLQSVVQLWRWRQGGGAADVVSERNMAIGRGCGGLLADSALPILDRYRRSVPL